MFHKANLPPQSPADVAGLHAATAESSTVTEQNLPPSPVPPGWKEISGSGNRKALPLKRSGSSSRVKETNQAGRLPASSFLSSFNRANSLQGDESRHSEASGAVQAIVGTQPHQIHNTMNASGKDSLPPNGEQRASAVFQVSEIQKRVRDGVLSAVDAQNISDAQKSAGMANPGATTQSMVPFPKNLAISRIRPGGMAIPGIEHPNLDTSNCTFCLYETDVGIQGDYFLLPGAAGKGMCRICESEGNKFFEVWQEIMENSGPIQPVAEERMQHLMSLGLNPPIKSREGRTETAPKVSKIDGHNISRFQGLHFCKCCPWTMVDVKRVKICQACRSEKHDIIIHRHRSFVTINSFREYTKPEEKLNPLRESARIARRRRCMICSGLASEKCAKCPLRLCANCGTLLTSQCKGYLDNLFYLYDLDHLRNDAFLLRSDLDPMELLYKIGK